MRQLVFIFILLFNIQIILTANLIIRKKRNIITDLGNVHVLLKGFLQMSENVPLTPKRKSNFPSLPIKYQIVDQTEYSANKKILGEVFESDLVLTENQMLDVIEDFKSSINTHKRTKRKAIIGNEFRWMNRTIPYKFNDKDAKWQELIRNGMSKWENETCLRFRPRNNEKDYVEFLKGGGCYSSVGRIRGKQYTSIGFGCESIGIVEHELGHAIGFWHEQSRPDRDKYININEDHIYRGTKGNFEKRKDVEGLKDVPYDFGSIMHYGPQAFTDNYKFVTIETKDHRYQHTIGQRQDLSFTDIKQANFLYCNDICKTQLSCQYGGYPDPHNCAKCKCPTGLAGNLCDALPLSKIGCGGELFAATFWQLLSNTIDGECFWRINAPINQRILFEVLESNFECDSSCSQSYLEVKHTDNFQRTGFRQCCNAAPGPIISQQNQVLVFSKSSTLSANFTIRYIIDSENLPQPPLAAWRGGGFTSLLGGEIGIDNTFETYIIKELPKAIKTKQHAQKPIDALQTLISSFLRSTRT